MVIKSLSVALRQLSLKGEPRLASHFGGGGIAKCDDGEGNLPLTQGEVSRSDGEGNLAPTQGELATEGCLRGQN